MSDRSDRSDQPYLAGRGIADVTGEAAGVGMMGYGRPDQKTEGIHQRQRSRAFVFADPASGDRVVFVQADVGMIFASVHQAVLRRLAERHGALYTERNVLLSANHTHCGPGGFSHHLLYNLTTRGFRPKTFAAIVDGIVESIERAHTDLAPASLRLSHGELYDASANRARLPFEHNPVEDRAFFGPEAIDPQTTLLRIDRGGRTVGVINWFPTHGTSLTNRNRLISPDNKGYAAWHWEHEVAGVDYRDERSPAFVAAFAQTNAGDMSPNLGLAPGVGPTHDEFENARIIGLRQFEAAYAQLAAPSARPVTGGVDARFAWVDMSRVDVRPEFTGDGRGHRTAGSAIGATFAGGSTEDGPGPAIFTRRSFGHNPVSVAVTRMLYRASPQLRAAQSPKEILLASGMPTPLPLIPDGVMPLQLLRIGPLWLAAVPGEPTIVSGLRIRRTVAGIVGADVRDVLAVGYSNAYGHYVTTPEEYDAQEYEGASTLFGRWTLPAYQQGFAALATAMRDGAEVDRGKAPRDLPGSRPSLPPAVLPDAVPPGHAFGDVLTQPYDRYPPGGQVVVEFAGGHPANDLRRGGTFLEVQRLDGGVWRTVADDGDWSTRFQWRRRLPVGSVATVSWDVPGDVLPGEYRIVHHGDARDLRGRIRSFTGTSRTFTVTA